MSSSTVPSNTITRKRGRRPGQLNRKTIRTQRWLKSLRAQFNNDTSRTIEVTIEENKQAESNVENAVIDNVSIQPVPVIVQEERNELDAKVPEMQTSTTELETTSSFNEEYNSPNSIMYILHSPTVVQKVDYEIICPWLDHNKAVYFFKERKMRRLGPMSICLPALTEEDLQLSNVCQRCQKMRTDLHLCKICYDEITYITLCPEVLMEKVGQHNIHPDYPSCAYDFAEVQTLNGQQTLELNMEKRFMLIANVINHYGSDSDRVNYAVRLLDSFESRQHKMIFDANYALQLLENEENREQNIIVSFALFVFGREIRSFLPPCDMDELEMIINGKF